MSDNEERQHLEELKHGHQRRLRALELQAAPYGALTPPAIVIENEDIRDALAQLDSTLDQQPTVSGLDVRSMSRPARHHLPAQTTTMVGREREIAWADGDRLTLDQAIEEAVRLAGPSKMRNKFTFLFRLNNISIPDGGSHDQVQGTFQ